MTCTVNGVTQPVLLYACNGVDTPAWLAAIRAELPDVEVREFPAVGDPQEIDFAFVWKYPPGLLRTLPLLRAIFSLGAGVESILSDPDLPPAIPLVRMVDPGLAIGMNEFVLMRVLHYHRQMPQHEANQRLQKWARLVPPLPQDRSVGILGCGQLGGMCARTLIGLGFDVAAWSRTPKNISGAKMYAGTEQLDKFLARTEILVCLLPLTPDTAGIINARNLSLLPSSAFFINVARGQHVVDVDLLAALDSGHIAGATLDVFQTEPLPPDHRYWDHPRVTVVPHMAAVTQIKTAARTLAGNVRRVLAGEPIADVVDRVRGY
jgi:glyoxylate/hydroxypyruvate reductase A